MLGLIIGPRCVPVPCTCFWNMFNVVPFLLFGSRQASERKCSRVKLVKPDLAMSLQGLYPGRRNRSTFHTPWVQWVTQASQLTSTTVHERVVQTSNRMFLLSTEKKRQHRYRHMAPNASPNPMALVAIRPYDRCYNARRFPPAPRVSRTPPNNQSWVRHLPGRQAARQHPKKIPRQRHNQELPAM